MTFLTDHDELPLSVDWFRLFRCVIQQSLALLMFM